jgi:predicted permease
MSLRSRIVTWWRAMTRGAQFDAQVEEELRFHIESYAEDLMRNGLPRHEATRRARAELGSIAARKENCRAAWGTSFFDELGGDLRFAMRMLAKSPGLAAIAIGSLALGIGANTVIFTAAQHMLLDRLNVPHPEELRLLWWTQSKDGAVGDMWGYFDHDSEDRQRSTSFSYPVYRLLRQSNRDLEDLFAFKPLDRQTVTVNGHAEAVGAELVSGNYFQVLGVLPQLGRAIQDSDDGAPGSSPVVVISDRFWTRHFARSNDVLGKAILVNAVPLTIIGVSPPGFSGAYSAQGTPDIFLPFSMQPSVVPQPFFGDHEGPSLLTNTDLWWVLVMGRANTSISDRTAEAALNVDLNAAVRATMPAKAGKQAPQLLLLDGSRGQNPAAEGLTRPIYVLMGLSGFVLLLACANLANLLLARAGARQREVSVRVALGASRRRILRQMLTESLTLSLVGGAAGLLLAYLVRNAIPHLLSNSWTPPPFSPRFDWKILSFATAVSILTGLVFGLAPAWESARVQISSGLKDSAQTASRRRRGLAGKAIVIIQVALSMLLVVGAGLFVQTLSQLGRARLGFQPDHLLLFGVEPPRNSYPGAKTTQLYEQIEDKLAAIPGVQSVTLTGLPLIAGNVSVHSIVPDGQQRKAEGNPSALSNDVGRTFFSTFAIPIIAGRAFDATDTETSVKVAVINESLAKKYFAGRSPVGRTFEFGGDHPTRLQIVGVSADTKYDRLRKSPEPTFYLPYWQGKNGDSDVTFAVSTHMDTQALLPALRQAVGSIDGNLPILDVRTQNEQIASTMRNERNFADLTAVFGVLALVLAAIGIYGIMAYAVSRRTNEIGIRMALGAEPRRILAMVVREASLLAAIGIASGVCAALAMGRLIASMLYGLRSWDPGTFVASAALLIAVAVAASWIPARRAARMNPVRALRHE